MVDNVEKILDVEQWKAEARAVINDVSSHVQDIRVSEKLLSTNSCIYLNLTTLEGLQFCVQMSGDGFTIIGNAHDINTNTAGEIFETPYSLLDFISPKYRESFSNELINKLNKLSQE